MADFGISGVEPSDSTNTCASKLFITGLKVVLEKGMILS
jgi:hypothetical protein